VVELKCFGTRPGEGNAALVVMGGVQDEAARLALARASHKPACVFIDGGIMSNFPINLFHRPDRVPSAPTFGVKLGVDDRKTDDITKPFSLLRVIFDSARFNLDADFIARNPDYRKLVSCIGTGSHNWLNFGMSDDDKLDLFKKGAAEADRFLREFDWAEYKKIRRGIAQTINDADLKKETMAGDGVRSAVKST